MRSACRSHSCRIGVGGAWARTVGLTMAAVAGCRQPDARHAEPARTASEAEPSGTLAVSDSAPADASMLAALRACVPAPTLVAHPGCALGARGGPTPVVCADLAPGGSPDVDVLSVLVARGPCDFAHALGIPSMQAAIDGGGSGLEAMRKTYRDFEGPTSTALADGRPVTLEARGLMLGGVIRWATLASPRGTFTTVVIQQIPLHDAPLADPDRAAVEGWDLRVIIDCVDRHLWSASSRVSRPARSARASPR